MRWKQMELEQLSEKFVRRRCLFHFERSRKGGLLLELCLTNENAIKSPGAFESFTVSLKAGS